MASPERTEHPPDWHNLPVAEVLTALAADHAGLAPDEAAQRLRQHGPNRLPAAQRDSLLVAVNALVMGEIFYLINCRFLTEPSYGLHGFTPSRPLLLSVFAVAALQAMFTYVPLFQQLFGTAAIDAAAWWRIFVFGTILFVAVEIEKAWIRHQNRRQGIKA